jgi:hypothetical protein
MGMVGREKVPKDFNLNIEVGKLDRLFEEQ